MKSLLAGVAAVVALAAPLGAAHAGSNVVVRVDTPEIGIRIGTPRVIHQPVYVPPPVVYAPPPVVYAPPRVGYTPPPRVIVPAPVYHPRHAHGHAHHRHGHGHGHGHHLHDGHRHDQRDDRRGRY